MKPLLDPQFLIPVSLILWALIMYLTYRSTAKAPKKARIAIQACRIISMLIITVIVFNPGSWKSNDENSRKKVAVLVDRSASMQTIDSDQTKSRWQQALDLTAKLQKASPEKVTFFTFADGLEAEINEAGNLKSMQASGKTSDQLASLKQAGTYFGNDSAGLSSILLLSDGRQLIAPAEDEVERAISPLLADNIPVYAIPMGENYRRKDLQLELKERYFDLFKGQLMTLTGHINNANCGRRDLKVSVFGKDSKLLAEKRILATDNSHTPFNINLSFKEKGEYHLNVRLTELHDEVNHLNNRQNCTVRVTDRHLNVLFLEGEPFWDSKFLTRQLRKNQSINLTAIYRLTSERFLKVNSENREELTENSEIIPLDSSDWGKFDTIIIGKGIESFVNGERIEELRQYVSNLGGTIIYARGKPYRDNFPQLAPLESMIWGNAEEGEYHWQTVNAGYNSFADRLVGSDQSQWQALPALSKVYKCTKMKPHARVIMQTLNKFGGIFPVLLQQHYGNGNLITVNTEDLWRWDFFPTEKVMEEFYGRFWTQLIFWAAQESGFAGQSYSLQLNQSTINEKKSAYVSVISRKKASNKALLNIYRDEKLYRSVGLKFVKEDSVWRTDQIVSNLEPGYYRMSIAEENSAENQSNSVTIQVKPLPSEKSQLSADLPFLQQICQKSGGKVTNFDDIEKLIKTQQKSTVINKNDAEWEPAWAMAPLMLIFVLFAGLETFIRRREGMI